YMQPKDPTIIEVGPAHYISIEGQSAPEGEAFQQSVGALYSLAFTMKMMQQTQAKKNYSVNPLEGLWWADVKDTESFRQLPRDQWRFKLLMRVPKFITKENLAQAIEACEGRNEKAPHERIKLETIEEGTCVQMLHVGPYSEEPANIDRMHDFAKAQGYVLDGKHHEIYLSNPQTTPPEKLKTILRQPIRKPQEKGIGQ
ncbi:MAG: GyrI-like domain-containing protein, partial [Planctomycetota bacterium]|nr:GyrI-like domain-containing protein [Planctomycetota bacterium]